MWNVRGAGRSLRDPTGAAGGGSIIAPGYGQLGPIGAGATGGKLLGAGGGGFMLLVAPPDLRERVRERLRGLTEVMFKIGTPGSRIVICEPDLEMAPD